MSLLLGVPNYDAYVFGMVATVILGLTTPAEANPLFGLKSPVADGDDVREVEEQHLAIICGDPAVALP